MKKEILNFSDCTMANLDNMFGLKIRSMLPCLQTWLEGEAELTSYERENLPILQHSLSENAYNWNKQELAMYSIGPILALVQFDYNRQFNLFSKRPFGGVINGTELGGIADTLIATGYREPEKPYFYFQEYQAERPTIEEGGNGDPQAQALAAMLVAQTLNEGQFPIYGCYVRGRSWYFMTLEGKNYAFSDGYVATKAEIFDILRILKVLKQMIIERVVSSQLTMDNKPMTTDKGRLTTNQ